jgi:hypothetical protein
MAGGAGRNANPATVAWEEDYDMILPRKESRPELRRGREREKGGTDAGGWGEGRCGGAGNDKSAGGAKRTEGDLPQRFYGISELCPQQLSATATCRFRHRRRRLVDESRRGGRCGVRRALLVTYRRRRRCASRGSARRTGRRRP